MTWLLMSLMLFPATGNTAERHSLFEKGEEVVTFVLKDSHGKTPRLILFDDPSQAATADSINYWRDTRDLLKVGVAVDFKGIRFLRSGADADQVVVRLVGIKNELELGTTIPLEDLEGGQPKRLRFGPVTLGAGIISGTTDARMLLQYRPETRTLEIAKVSGQFEWNRWFHDSQQDSGKLENVSGAVGTIPLGGAILKSPIDSNPQTSRQSGVLDSKNRAR